MSIKTDNTVRRSPKDGDAPGIVITAGGQGLLLAPPRIVAFIWGGKVRPTPTLPFGRWKSVA